jgi:hypothetical protein
MELLSNVLIYYFELHALNNLTKISMHEEVKNELNGKTIEID